MRPNQQVETFPDGIVEVYEETNRTIGSKPKLKLRFEKYTVGVRRYYDSQTSAAGNRIDRVIKVPHTNLVNRMDIAIVTSEDNKQYRIQRIQGLQEGRSNTQWELQTVQVKIRSEVVPDPPTPDPVDPVTPTDPTDPTDPADPSGQG